MSAVGSYIKQFPLSMDQWTPIVCPLNCAYYMIIGNTDGSAMERCSDSSDPTTAYQMPPLGWFSYQCTAFYQRYRFTVGNVVTYLKATQLGTIAIVEFYN